MTVEHNGIDIDKLLKGAFPSGPRPTPPDLGSTLRRLSATVARRKAGLESAPEWARRASQARACLEVLAVSIVNDPSAAAHLDRLGRPCANTPEDLDGRMAGWRVFGCLLYLNGHPDSAAFWWGIAAGGGDATAAECRALQQQIRGEARAIESTRAAGWTPIPALGDLSEMLAFAPTLPPLPRDLIHHYHAGAAAAPPDVLAQAVIGIEVDRLGVHDVPGAGADGLVEEPGPCLANRLRELAGQH